MLWVRWDGLKKFQRDAWNLRRPSWGLWQIECVRKLTARGRCSHPKPLYNLPVTTTCSHWRAQALSTSASDVLGELGKEAGSHFYIWLEGPPSLRLVELFTFQVPDLLGQFLYASQHQKHRGAEKSLSALPEDPRLSWPVSSLLPTLMLLFTCKAWQEFNMFLLFFHFREKSWLSQT